jgi:N6-adenosine-specific RNA methylase IME4
MTERRAVSDLRLGLRHRRDPGDLHALADSIAAVGLLHPVVIRPDNRLVAGARRLEAVRLLGWTEVPVTVVDPDDVLRAEADENVVRKDFTPSEAVAIHRDLAGQLATPVGRPNNGGNFPPIPRGKTRDKVAAYVGMSGRTLDKAVAVVEAAEAEPELHDLVVLMDDTGKVDHAYRELQRRRNRRLVNATVPVGQYIAGQRFRCLVLDPPWDYDGEGASGRAAPTYATMTDAEIAALPVDALAEPAAHLYLWVTNFSLPRGFDLIRAWGFRYVTALTWCKPSIGVGAYFRNSTEHLLFAVKGSLPLFYADQGTWFEAPRGRRHSDKPEALYDIVRRNSPGPRLEMFARGPREGFVVWGAEAPAIPPVEVRAPFGSRLTARTRSAETLTVGSKP